MTQKPESFQFQAEIQQLLSILVHSLYTDKEIFLRELISNASDALNRVQFEMLTNDEVLDADAELAIWLEADEDAKTITLRDTGIGMTYDELIANLGTIAKSGASEFLAQLKSQKEHTNNIIGKFGVGFYSVFMVAKEVEVISKSYRKDAEAVRWTSDGSSTYTIDTADKADRGTTIIIKLNDDSDEFANIHRLESIVRKHSDFVTFPIYVKNEGKDDDEPRTVNQQTALWRQSASEIDDEKYNDFYKQLTMDFTDPIAHIHLSADAPVQVNALLFFPAVREGNMFSLRQEPGLKLYSRNVLIEEYTTDLLPNHFRFIHGVVDSEDISLSVSRESVQNTRVINKLKGLLTKRVIRTLEELGEKDAEKYKAFWKEFSPFIKEGIATDPTATESLLPLLRFHASNVDSDVLVSLKDYVESLPEGQSDIYYLIADGVSAANNSPHMDSFKKRDIPVLYFVDAIDSFMLNSLREFDGHSLKNVDTVELDATEEDTAAEEEAKNKLPDDQFAEVVTRFKSVLGDKIEDVKEAKSLSSSPIRLVAPEGAEGKEMDRIRRMLEQDYEVPKRVVEINRGHSIIQNIASLLKTDFGKADLFIEQLFDNALLGEGLHPNPAEMLPRIQKLMELLSDA